ncbi:SDR family oxidoreductase [Alcanivorax sediminis]|uniref:SDR family NAD(P)-dependent oxidoreductase n=1 Tax=Alcanivorax sediminis TaxID=2663008 RepID=A0A6N7LUR6_9GAMM|nr:SDR family oxidoreductase [Alcanivorax sediminis]MQX52954.1 SDR family NAD(P)-dependent oxidoreductase [Alcanivorax sediminis]
MSKRVLITGGNSGIGLCTAEQLAGRGAEVILACRDQDRGRAAVARIKNTHPSAKVRLFDLDLSDLESVRNSAAVIYRELDHIDVLINNAGVVPTKQGFTNDGYEMQFGVNYLAPVLFTHLMLPLLQKGEQPRILHVASVAHWLGRINKKTWRGRKPYLVMDAYGQSKLGNILFSNVLADRLAELGITSNALHPGGVDTPIFRYVPKPIMALIRPTLTTPEKAARLPVSLALDPQYADVSGEYFANFKPAMRSPLARNSKLAETLYYDTMAELDLPAL